MSKYLLVLMTALILPITSYTANINGPLGVQVLPPVACDAGYPSGLPSVAWSAGFTHCVLNADFTKVGGAFSDKTKFIDACGATGNRIFQAYYAYSQLPVPCYRMTIEQDNGTQVFHLTYVTGDSDPTGRIHPLELAYPNVQHSGAVGTPFPEPGPGIDSLPQEMYTEITFRMSTSSLTQGKFSIPFAWWQLGRADPPQDQSVEVDYLEVQSDSNNGSGWAQGTGMREWGCSNCNRTNREIQMRADFTQYHKFGALITSDLKTNISKCLFMDDVLVGCQNLSPSDAAAYRTDRGRFRTFNLIWVGSNENSTPNPIDIYIKSMTIWQCATYLTTNCTGSKWYDYGNLDYWHN